MVKLLAVTTPEAKEIAEILAGITPIEALVKVTLLVPAFKVLMTILNEPLLRLEVIFTSPPTVPAEPLMIMELVSFKVRAPTLLLPMAIVPKSLLGLSKVMVPVPVL